MLRHRFQPLQVQPHLSITRASFNGCGQIGKQPRKESVVVNHKLPENKDDVLVILLTACYSARPA